MKFRQLHHRVVARRIKGDEKFAGDNVIRHTAKPSRHVV
jgi:hypothetical protein